MGVGGVIFLSGMVAAIGAVLTIIGALLVRRGVRKDASIPIVLGLPMGCVGAIFFVGGAVWAGMWIVNMSSSHESSDLQEFARVLHVAPTSDVTELRYQSRGSTDWYQQLLRFRCAPRTVDRIAKDRFRQVEIGRCASMRSDDDPEWWQPKVGASSRCFRGEGDEVLLLHDPASGEVHFLSLEID